MIFLIGPVMHAFGPGRRNVLFLAFLDQVGCLHVVIQCAGLELADPDPDQLP